MQRAIVDLHQDDVGEWVAELSCHHRQHVRHRPPFLVAPWVLDDAERSGRIGSPLDYPLCDRAELPDGLRVVRTTPTWDEGSMPAGLRRAHRLGRGIWGLVRVQEGQVRFRADTDPPLEVIVGPDGAQAIPPETEHDVEPQGWVRFFVEFLDRPASASSRPRRCCGGMSGPPRPGAP